MPRPASRSASRPRTDRLGPDRLGPDRLGPDRLAPDRLGPDRRGTDRLGTDRLGPADTGALLLILLAACYVGVVNGHYSYDDAFITFRMAENFAAGVGFVYNPGEWHLGSTAAFYGLTLGAVSALVDAVGGRARGAASIPAIAGLLSTLSLLATGWLLYGLGRAGGAARCGLIAGLFYVANPMIFVTFGGEMPFQLALITGAFFAHRQGARTVATVLAALAIVTRPDGVLAAGVLLAHDVVTRRRVPWRELMVAALILLPFAGLAWYAYGSPLPSTLGAKLAQRDSGLWTPYGRGLLDWVRLFVWNDRGPNLGFAPVAPPTLWLWILLGVAGVWRYRVFWPLLAWAVLFVGAYSLARIPFYHWYAAPAVLALAIVAACGLCAVAEGLLALWRARAPRTATGATSGAASGLAKGASSSGLAAAIGDRAETIATAAVVLAACAISLKPVLALPRTSTLNPTVNLYIHAGRWLDEQTPPSISVGYYEIGYIGFYGHRRMIDSLGLIDPRIAPAVARRDFVYAFREARPDLILEKRGAGLNGFLQEPWFKEEYRQRAVLSIGALGGRSAEALIVHERVTPAPTVPTASKPGV